MLPGLSIVIGGIGSGKAEFAESLCLGSGRGPVCIVTSDTADPAYKAKETRREAVWTTFTEPLDIGRTLATISGDAVVLMDALPEWLENLAAADKDLAEAEAELMAGLALCAAPVLVLTHEPAPSHPPEMRAALSRLNRKLATKAGLAVNVVAGLPQVLKGDLP